MKIHVNGEVRELREGATVLALVQELGFDPKVMVAQRNDAIIGRDAFGDTALAEGDRLELLRLVGGG